MPETGPMDERRFDDGMLDDLTLEALAETAATPPPARLRGRVLAEAHADAAAAGAGRGRTMWRIVGAVAATIAVALGTLLVGTVGELAEQRRALDRLAAVNDELGAEVLARQRAVAELEASLTVQSGLLRVLGAPGLMTAALAPQAPYTGGGTVHLDPATGTGAVVLADVATLPPDRVYELWAIRGNAPPEPAGLLPTGLDGVFAASVRGVVEPRGVTAFAVSIEPRGGSPTPTGPIVLVGAVAS